MIVNCNKHFSCIITLNPHKLPRIKNSQSFDRLSNTQLVSRIQFHPELEFHPGLSDFKKSKLFPIALHFFIMYVYKTQRTPSVTTFGVIVSFLCY